MMILPLSSLQIIADVYHFSDIPHLAVPKGGLDPFFSKQQRRWCWETLRELEKKKKKNVSLDCIKHLKLELCHISAYLWLCVCVCVCVGEVMVMVLLGRCDLWEASFYARGPGSISDHFNGQEHQGGCYHPPGWGQRQHTHLCLSYRLTDNEGWSWHNSFKPGASISLQQGFRRCCLDSLPCHSAALCNKDTGTLWMYFRKAVLLSHWPACFKSTLKQL